MVNQEKMKGLDSHWKEVMDLAIKYGFICQAYGGTAVLATHQNQLKEWGEEKYLHMQKEMHRNDMADIDSQQKCLAKTLKLRVLCRHTNLGNGVKIDLSNETPNQTHGGF